MAQSTNKGRDFDVWNLTLNATTYTKFIPNRNLNSIIIQCRDAADIYLSESGAGNTYLTIKSGTVFTLDINTINFEPLYLKAASGTPVAEIIGIYE